MFASYRFCFLSLVVFFSISIHSQLAGAQMGSEVLIYCGQQGECQDGFVNMSDQLIKAGASKVQELSDWPTNLSAYRLIFLVLPRENFDDDQIEQMRGFLLEGGKVIMIGEYTSYSSGSIDILNSLLGKLNYTMRLGTDELDCGCEQQSKKMAAHPLMYGMEYMEFACTTVLYTNEGLALASTSDGTAFIGIEKDNMIVAGDSNVFSDLCGDYDTRGNRAFFTNLITGGSAVLKKSPYGK